jgi:carbon-monoxide dehydrogenase small subunit
MRTPRRRTMDIEIAGIAVIARDRRDRNTSALCDVGLRVENIYAGRKGTQGRMKKELIELRVNGRRHELAVEPSELLLDVLRRDLQLTGSKRGCDDSSCGACTVLVDGVPTLSCTMLAMSASANGPAAPEITTVEGIADHGALAAIQKAYGDWGGAQCGYCTPGFMITVKALLDRNPDPTEEDIRHALSGNLCRCTGYNQMYQAIKAAIVTEKARR